jgi:hypothetical protein
VGHIVEEASRLVSGKELYRGGYGRIGTGRWRLHCLYLIPIRGVACLERVGYAATSSCWVLNAPKASRRMFITCTLVASSIHTSTLHLLSSQCWLMCHNHRRSSPRLLDSPVYQQISEIDNLAIIHAFCKPTQCSISPLSPPRSRLRLPPLRTYT